LLKEIDRVQLATPDASGAARNWQRLLGAEVIHQDRVACLGAKRVTLRVGFSDIEILEPDGAGTVDSELRRRGRAHLFAAGASSPHPDRAAKCAEASGATHIEDSRRHYLTLMMEGAPIRFVISPEEAREPVGDIDFLYEVTLLAADQTAAVRQIRDAFDLDDAHFTTITSEHFGYSGVLTLFREGALHRFEVITPRDKQKTMGRYHAREGASFYMAFAESARLAHIEREAKKVDAGITVDRPNDRPASRTADQLWLHPSALGGMMLGVSRPSMAWRWSGHPERVVSIA
jgi:hypothetical protein